MGVKRNYRIAFITSFIIIILCLTATVLDKSSIQNTIVTITAVIGAVAIWFEMKRSKDMAEGEFITSLNQSFSSNEEVKSLYSKLVSGEEIKESDRLAIVEYLTFFETIYLLLKKDVINIELLDDLFCYRFFLAVNNKSIQELELIADAQYYTNIYTLDYIWGRYRKKHNKSVQQENSLRKNNSDYFKYVKVKQKCNKYR